MHIILRRIYHATETDEKKTERFITNCYFLNKFGKSMKLYPISEAIDSKCKVCGKDGIAMDEFMAVYCRDCLIKLFNKTEVIEEKALAVPSIEMARLGNAFEWQPQGNENWYKIKGVNIIPDSQIQLSKEEIKRRFNEIISKILNDEPQFLEGNYEKETKILTIYV